MLLGLTTDQKLGLAGTAAVFIVFSLVAALLIPRYRPDFPGRKGLGLFLVLTALLMVGMLGAVVVFAKEDHAEAAGETHATESNGGSETGETNATGQTTPPATTEAKRPAGDAAAGKTVYGSSGCGSCHTFDPAGSDAAVGPNLNESIEGKDLEYVQRAIVEPNAEVAEGYQEGSMPWFDQLSDEQVGDLVAFLTQS